MRSSQAWPGAVLSAAQQMVLLRGEGSEFPRVSLDLNVITCLPAVANL